MFNLSQKGVSLYIALMMITVILGIALGISIILLGQIKMIRGMGDSVIAFSAADTGIEKILYENSKGIDIVLLCNPAAPDPDCQGILNGDGASFSVIVLPGGDPPPPNCPGEYYCLRSVGNYKGTRRAIQVSR